MKIIYGIFLFHIVNPVYAETFAAKDLVELAVSRSPELKALKSEASAQKSLVDQAGRWENPNLELGGERKELNYGKTDFVKFGLSQQFPRPARLQAKAESVTATAQIAQVEHDAYVIRLKNEVLRLIYEYRAAQEKTLHAEERLQRFRTIETYLRSRPIASPQKRAEASIVRSKLLLLGRELRKMEASRRISWNQLNLYLDLNAEPSIRADWFKPGPALRFEELLAKARTFSPQLRSQEFKTKQAESELKFAKTSSLPGFALSASYADGSGAEPEKVYGLGLTLPLPVLNTYSSAVSGAQSQVSAAQSRQEFAVKQLSAQLRSAIENYQEARTSIEELKVDGLPRLEKDMHSIDESFKKGQVDLLVYLEADTEHAENLNAIFDSQVDFVAARAAVYELTGQAPLEAE